MSVIRTDKHNLSQTKVLCQDVPAQKSGYVTFRLQSTELKTLCDFFEKQDHNTDALVCQLILIRACTPSLQTVPLADIIERLRLPYFPHDKQAKDNNESR